MLGSTDVNSVRAEFIVVTSAHTIVVTSPPSATHLALGQALDASNLRTYIRTHSTLTSAL